MATLYKADGRIVIIKPANGRFTLKEVQGYVGGYVQLIEIPGNKCLYMNEDGKAMRLPPNPKATWFARHGGGISHLDVVVGDCVLCSEEESMD